MKKVKCPKCNHEWETKSKLVLVTCPSCQLKVRIKKEARGDDLPDGTHNRNYVQSSKAGLKGINK